DVVTGVVVARTVVITRIVVAGVLARVVVARTVVIREHIVVSGDRIARFPRVGTRSASGEPGADRNRKPRRTPLQRTCHEARLCSLSDLNDAVPRHGPDALSLPQIASEATSPGRPDREPRGGPGRF